MTFEDRLKTAREKFDNFITLKVFGLFFIAIVIILAITGDWIGGISTFVLFMFYKKLISKYKNKVMEIKQNG